MSDEGPGAPSADAFDIRTVAAAVGYPLLHDDRGRFHFPGQKGSAVIMPMGATATCDVTTVPPSAALYHHRLDEVGTEGAIRALASLPELRRRLESVGVAQRAAAPIDPFLGALDLNVLRWHFRVGEALAVPSEGNRPAGVLYRSLEDFLGFVPPQEPVDDGAEHRVQVYLRLPEHAHPRNAHEFRLTPAGVLLLIALQEVLKCISLAELERDVDYGRLTTVVRRDVLEVRENLRGGMDALEGYRALARALDPAGQPEFSADMWPGQLAALAMTALRKCMARRGRPSSEGQVDAAVVAAATGREPDWIGDELALGFRDLRLAVRVEGGEAIGWGTTLVADHGLTETPVVLTHRALAHVAWAAAAHDLPAARSCGELHEYVGRALHEPWFDAVTGSAGVREALETMAGERRWWSRRALRAVLNRAPD